MNDRETARVLLEKYRDGAMNCDPVGQIATALAAARRQGLEEAAKVAETMDYPMVAPPHDEAISMDAMAQRIADGIRTLIDQPASRDLPAELAAVKRSIDRQDAATKSYLSGRFDMGRRLRL